MGWYARFDFVVDEIVDQPYCAEEPGFVFGAVWDIEGVEIEPVLARKCKEFFLDSCDLYATELIKESVPGRYGDLASSHVPSGSL